VAIEARRGFHFVSATLVGANGVKHNIRSLSRGGVMRNSRRRAIRIGSGTSRIRVRTARSTGRSTSRLYTLHIPS
jgi:hypothetical protein